VRSILKQQQSMVPVLSPAIVVAAVFHQWTVRRLVMKWQENLNAVNAHVHLQAKIWK